LPSQWPDNFLRLVRKGLSETHGLPGAIMLLYLNDLLRHYPSKPAPAVRRFCVEWAAMAVMMHDMCEIYSEIVQSEDDRDSLHVKNSQLRLRFNKDPLSFVLTLSDQLQDFGRPDANFFSESKQPPRNSSQSQFCCADNEVCVAYRSRCDKVFCDWNEDSGLLKIIKHYTNPADYALNLHKYVPRTQLQYFDRHSGFLDPLGSGIDRILLDVDRSDLKPD